MTHFKTTPPACQRCAHCGRLVVTGHATGLPYRFEPMPVTARGAALAYRDGLHVWTLGVHDHIQYRDVEAFLKAPENGPHFVHHRCSRPTPTEYCDERFASRTGDLVSKWLHDAAVDLFASELGAVVLTEDGEPVPGTNATIAERVRANLSRGRHARSKAETGDGVPFF